MLQTIDDSGFKRCTSCLKRTETFPYKLNDPKKISKTCLSCQMKNKERNDKRYAPFLTQVEEYRKRFPRCAISGVVIKDGIWDHLPEFKKIKSVTDYSYWASRSGTLVEKLILHRDELDKCQHVTRAVYLRINNEHMELSQSKIAVYSRNRKLKLKQENWNWIQTKQDGLCGCGCETLLSPDDSIEFDHEKGEKKFNICDGSRYSKEARDAERMKGSFKLTACHRKITKKRLSEAHEERIIKHTKVN
jgi:hypothetical protein